MKLGYITRPHCIINNLHRSRLDPNREFYQATMGNVVS